ncbi:hypothetical protein ACTHAL_000389 [Priestia flexa]|uniref:hypothetical protein n=1 Tax=Priestia flexa TaxID=86664 RepID=UPI000C235F82|nr:hypothetical protein [Priestia flexa]MEC0668404.1 hypothetical protein [Priestia flexa]
MSIAIEAGTSFATINDAIMGLAAQIQEVTATIEEVSNGTTAVTNSITQVKIRTSGWQLAKRIRCHARTARFNGRDYSFS